MMQDPDNKLPQTDDAAIALLQTTGGMMAKLLTTTYECARKLHPDWSIPRCYFFTVCMGCKDGIEKSTQLSEGL